MSDTNDALLYWLEEVERIIGETATHVFVEQFDDEALKRRLLTRHEFCGDEWATRSFCAGFGGAGCPAVVMWTPNWILYAHEYDGATSLSKLPRAPCVPQNKVYYGDVFDF